MEPSGKHCGFCHMLKIRGGNARSHRCSDNVVFRNGKVFFLTEDGSPDTDRLQTPPGAGLERGSRAQPSH